MALTRYDVQCFGNEGLVADALPCKLQYHQSVIDNAREAERQLAGRPLAIALDTVRRPSLTCRNTHPCSEISENRELIITGSSERA